MIGIGTPINQSRMDRMKTSVDPARAAKNGPVAKQFRQPRAAVAGSAWCSRRPSIEARNMTVAA
jgi:hypothetical protein